MLRARSSEGDRRGGGCACWSRKLGDRRGAGAGSMERRLPSRISASARSAAARATLGSFASTAAASPARQPIQTCPTARDKIVDARPMRRNASRSFSRVHSVGSPSSTASFMSSRASLSSPSTYSHGNAAARHVCNAISSDRPQLSIAIKYPRRRSVRHAAGMRVIPSITQAMLSTPSRKTWMRRMRYY